MNFPGIYVITPGENLSEVINRAGGLTTRAFPDGAMFTRKSLADKESEQRDRLIARLEADLADASLQAINAQEAARSETAADAMLKRLQNTKSVGRLVINLSNIIKEPTSRLRTETSFIFLISLHPSVWLVKCSFPLLTYMIKNLVLMII